MNNANDQEVSPSMIHPSFDKERSGTTEGNLGSVESDTQTVPNQAEMESECNRATECNLEEVECGTQTVARQVEVAAESSGSTGGNLDRVGNCTGTAPNQVEIESEPNEYPSKRNTSKIKARQYRILESSDDDDDSKIKDRRHCLVDSSDDDDDRSSNLAKRLRKKLSVASARRKKSPVVGRNCNKSPSQSDESVHDFSDDDASHEDDESLFHSEGSRRSDDGSESMNSYDREFLDDRSVPLVATSSSNEEFMDDGNDEDDEAFILELLRKEQGKSKKRAAGTPPTTARQQVDANVRNKILGLEASITRIQQMSTPLAKLDGTHQMSAGRRKAEKGYPNVVFGIYYFTEQKPNADGTNNRGELFLDTPGLHLLTPSKHMSKVLHSVIGARKLPPGAKKSNSGQHKACTICTHETFKSFYDSLLDPATTAKEKSQHKGSLRHRSQKTAFLPNKKSKMFHAVAAALGMETSKKKKQD